MRVRSVPAGARRRGSRRCGADADRSRRFQRPVGTVCRGTPAMATHPSAAMRPYATRPIRWHFSPEVWLRRGPFCRSLRACHANNGSGDTEMGRNILRRPTCGRPIRSV
jgi:hypothetical protein